MKTIGVIDGQGGGIGGAIIKKLAESFTNGCEIIALGTNAIATAQMLKARANRGASGEHAIVHMAPKLDVIIGPVGIVFPHAMMGEVTLKIAEAVSLSPAKKILIPLSQENIDIVGLNVLPLPRLVDEMIETKLTPLLFGSDT